jgi:hypothetical protein
MTAPKDFQRLSKSDVSIIGLSKPIRVLSATLNIASKRRLCRGKQKATAMALKSSSGSETSFPNKMGKHGKFYLSKIFRVA